MRIIAASILLVFFGFGRPAYAQSGPAVPADPFLENLPTVEAASLHTQTLDEAPANVSVITRQQIRTYGYRTLGEALSSVRGFYMNWDHIYHQAGVRGFSLPGDFNTRFLVMVNGHPMTERVFSSNNFFGQDFGLDMDLVERIEIIRGPSSALYGSNGIFATINVVTVSPVDFPQAYGAVDAGSFGERKLLAAGSFDLGRGVNLLLSGSVVKSRGRTIYVPELDDPEHNFGRSIGMDGEGAYHTFANLTWRGWNVTAYFNTRDKRVPVAWDYTANSFGSRGNHAEDSRNFVSATNRRQWGPGQLQWQFSYDNYHYADRFDLRLPDDSLLPRNTHADANWLSSQLTYQVSGDALGIHGLGDLTLGIAGAFDLRNLQVDNLVGPPEVELIRIRRPERNGAVFVSDEKRISRSWKVDLGARFDVSRYYGQYVSPRAALSFQPSSRTVYKLVYGRPFRNPSEFEQFYFDNIAYLPARPLRHEIANTYEFSVEHHFTPRLTGTVSAFDYRLQHLIQAVYLDDGISRFENVKGTHTHGLEFEFGGEIARRVELNGSFVIQDAHNENPALHLSNSPRRIFKLRAAIPVVRRFKLAGSISTLTARNTWDGDPQRAVWMADFTATVDHVLAGYDLQVGVRNALNWSYYDPVGLSVDKLNGDPRGFFVRLSRRVER